MKKILFSGLILSLFSCQPNTSNKEGQATAKNDSVKGVAVQQITQPTFSNATDFAQFCDSTLRAGKVNALKPFVHTGLLFSPYAFVDTTQARTEKLENLVSPSTQLHFWGIYQGRGDSINLSTVDYLKQFVFNFPNKKDAVQVFSYSGKSPKKRGNEQQNLHKIYPHSTFVELYHPPSKKGYMDWSSLIYVVRKEDKQFYLIAIVHNQWTS